MPHGWCGGIDRRRRLNPDFTLLFCPYWVDSHRFKVVFWGRFRIKRIRKESSQPRQGVSVAQRRRISTLILGRVARNLMARASSGSGALLSLWPGRTDRPIIAPHELRTGGAARAAGNHGG